MTGIFDPTVFEQTVIETANETVYTPIPAGAYVALVKDFKVRTLASKTVGESDSHPMDVFYSLQDAALKAALEKDEVIVRGGIWLDIEDDGSIKFGTNQNVGLGQLRDAVGQNQSGVPWAPSMLRGAGPVLINVTVDPIKDGKGPYNRVISVVRHIV
jgi:hypothetical protein